MKYMQFFGRRNEKNKFCIGKREATMKTLTAFYFSGTGNTRYITEGLLKRLSSSYRTSAYDITKDNDIPSLLKATDVVLLAFPIYGSSPPIPMRKFVHRLGNELRGKEVIVVITQYFFSGDGAATIGRTVKKYGGKIIGAEHFNMPNNLSDCKLFPIRNGQELTGTLFKVNKRMDRFAGQLLKGKACKRGFTLLPHTVGFFSQRVFWRKNEAEKRKLLKVDPGLCTGCGACIKNCPVSNLELSSGKASSKDECVLCYRCVNLCPRRAITLIGSSAPQAQYKGVR